MLRRVVLLVVLGLVATGVVTWTQRSQRADEWEHGGDVTVQASVTTPSAQSFPTVLAQLGGPAGEVAPRGAQPVVARVTWDGTPTDGGTYAFVLLDGRVAPPTPLRGYGGWWPGDPAGAQGTGPHWDGRYDVLGEHYGWLAGTRPVRTGAGWTDRAEALGVPATEKGEATLAYLLDRNRLPAGSAADQLELALVFVDADGEVRWARRVPCTQPDATTRFVSANSGLPRGPTPDQPLTGPAVLSGSPGTPALHPPPMPRLGDGRRERARRSLARRGNAPVGVDNGGKSSSGALPRRTRSQERTTSSSTPSSATARAPTSTPAARSRAAPP